MSLALASASLWLLASPAQAASTYYVSRLGPRITVPCPQAEPCYLAVPLAAQEPGDTIILESGNYQGPPETPMGTTINLLKENVTLEGEPGAPAPKIFSNVKGGPAVRMTEAFGTRLANVDIEDSGTEVEGWPTLIAVNEAHFDHVILRSTTNERAACSGYDITFTDSICAGKDGFYVSTGGAFSPTINLRNSDLYGTETGMLLAGTGKIDLTANAVNTIIRGATTDISTEPVEAGGAVHLNLEHSNFGLTVPGGAGETTMSGGGNQSATPVFVNLAAGDFHEAPGSPTIDAGLDSPLNGLTDLAGNPRQIGAHTDIGAYEFLIAPGAETGAASGVAQTAATLNGTVNPNGSATSVTFRYGTSTAYGSSITVPSPGAGATAAAVSAALSGLVPGTTYHYELVASNAQGTSAGIDRTFTTLPVLPPVNKVPRYRPVLSELRISPRSLHAARHGPSATGDRRTGATVSYRVSEAASVSFAIQQSRPGRVGHGGHCVAQTHANRHARRCRRTVTLRRFTLQGAAGRDRFHLTGSGLHPGSYVLAAVPQSSGGTGATQKASFSVLK